VKSVIAKCDNCCRGFREGEFKPLSEVKALRLRLDSGSVVPLGECPGCGALCYGVGAEFAPPGELKRECDRALQGLKALEGSFETMAFTLRLLIDEIENHRSVAEAKVPVSVPPSPGARKGPRRKKRLPFYD
jgi:hypothetical protein